MRSPAIQTVAVKRILVNLSQKTGADFSIKKVRYGFNKNLIIKNFLVKDKNNDTIIYVRKINAGIKKIDLSKNEISINNLTVKDIYSDIYQTDSSEYNFSFIIDSLKNNSTKPFDWLIMCDELAIKNSNIFIKPGNKKQFHIENMNLKIQNIYIDSVLQSFNIVKFYSKLNGKEFLNDFSLQLYKKHNKIKLNNFKIFTQESQLNIEKSVFNLPDKKAHKHFSYSLKFLSSKISFSDISLFINKNISNIDNIVLSGVLKGGDDFIVGADFKIQTGEESSLFFDFDIKNIDDIKNIKYLFNINEFYTTKVDVINVLNNFSNYDTVNLSKQLSFIDNLSYNGSLKGDYNKLYNKGLFLSKIGQVESDISITNDRQNNKIWLNGDIKAEPVYLDLIANNDKTGEVAFKINANGYFAKSDDFNFDITGTINHIYYDKYKFDSINVNGIFNNEKFNGKVSSFDHNLRFDFDGTLNFDTIPSFNFVTDIYYANLYNLGINKKNKKSNLSLSLKADFEGSSFNNSTGEISVFDIFYFTDSSYFATDSIKIVSLPHNKGKLLTFESEFLNAEIDGNFNTLSFIKDFKSFISNFLPSINFTSHTKRRNIFSYKINFDYPRPLIELFNPELQISPGTSINGEFNSNENKLIFTCISDQIKFKNQRLDNVKLKAFTNDNRLYINLSSKEFKYTKKTSLKNFTVSSNIYSDSIFTNINWNNWLDLNYSGNINTLVSFCSKQTCEKPSVKLDIFPGNVVVMDTLWFFSQGFVKKDSSSYTFHNIEVDNGESRLHLSGILSDNPNDSIYVQVENINLVYLNYLLKNDNLIFGGKITGNTLIKDIRHKQNITSDLLIKKLSLNHRIIGDTKLVSSWDNINQNLIVNSISRQGEKKVFTYDGYISFNKKTIDIDTYFDSLPFKTIEPFLQPTFDKVSGFISGKIKVHGNLKDPMWEGQVYAENARMLVTPTKVYYRLSDSVYFHKYSIIFKKITVYDKNDNSGTVYGRITHKQFRDFFFNIKVLTDNLLAIDLKSSDNPYYYGKLYGSGIVEIKGPDVLIDINVAAKTKANSKIIIPLEGREDIKENKFIEFVSYASNYEQKTTKAAADKAATASTTNIHIDLKVTPDVEVEMIFDPIAGDKLKAIGTAHLNMESIGPDFKMFGTYTISKGDFTFTLQNVINKHLTIQEGSTVSWTGDPINALINMDAVYKIRKASVYDLTRDEADKTKRVEVNTHLLMTGRLNNPKINFSIEVPSTTNDDAIDQLNNLPEEDLNKQVLSLLLVNKFSPLSTSYQTDATSNTTANVTATTVSEFMSNQLSSWMSQISSDFDLGFVYRPGDETSQQEIEVALSKNFLNDRLIVNGNIGYSENMKEQTNTPITGDFMVEYKLNKKGNIRLRAFQKVNNDITYTQAPYTQGIGIFYTDEFNTFDDLLQKMFRRQSAKKPDEIRIEKEKK